MVWPAEIFLKRKQYMLFQLRRIGLNVPPQNWAVGIEGKEGS